MTPTSHPPVTRRCTPSQDAFQDAFAKQQENEVRHPRPTRVERSAFSGSSALLFAMVSIAASRVARSVGAPRSAANGHWTAAPPMRLAQAAHAAAATDTTNFALAGTDYRASGQELAV